VASGDDAGHDRCVSSSRAELASVVTALDELIRRVSSIADEAASGDQDDTATELFAVERALTAARRRLGRVVTPPGGIEAERRRQH
jgi:hypothetical protein